MKHCNDHMGAIITALNKRNLGHLISMSPEAVQAAAILWLTGNCRERDSVNPLVVVIIEIYQRAASTLPAYVQNPSVHYCPLCELSKIKGPHRPQEWIDGYSDEVRNMLREIEFVKP